MEQWLDAFTQKHLDNDDKTSLPRLYLTLLLRAALTDKAFHLANIIVAKIRTTPDWSYSDLVPLFTEDELKLVMMQTDYKEKDIYAAIGGFVDAVCGSDYPAHLSEFITFEVL